MERDLQKRLEETARKEVPDILRINGNYVESFITGFCLGGEWMFNECGSMTILHNMWKLILAQCKKWLETNIANQVEMMCAEGPLMMSKEAFLADFEAYMNKLLEEKK